MFVSSVSRYLGLSIVFTRDHEYFALLSSVGCIGTSTVSVVSGENKITIKLLRLHGAASGASRRNPLPDHYLGVNRQLRRLMGHSNHESPQVL